MGIQISPEGFIVVSLPQQPHLGHELEKINEIAYDGCDSDVIIDFSGVQMVTSASICNLLLLKDFLSAFSRKVLLCNVPLPVKCLFIRLGVDTLFEFADDRFTALQAGSQQPVR